MNDGDSISDKVYSVLDKKYPANIIVFRRTFNFN